MMSSLFSFPVSADCWVDASQACTLDFSLKPCSINQGFFFFLKKKLPSRKELSCCVSCSGLQWMLPLLLHQHWHTRQDGCGHHWQLAFSLNVSAQIYFLVGPGVGIGSILNLIRLMKGKHSFIKYSPGLEGSWEWNWKIQPLASRKQVWVGAGFSSVPSQATPSSSEEAYRFWNLPMERKNGVYHAFIPLMFPITAQQKAILKRTRFGGLSHISTYAT